MKKCLVSLLVGSALLGAAPWLAAQKGAGPGAPPPHLGYVYPAGAQQGTAIAVTLGGQHLAGARGVRITGSGIAARIDRYEHPIGQKELVALREEAQVLRKRLVEEKAAFTPTDRKKLTELETLLARDRKRRASPALAETLTLTISLAPDAAIGPCELRLLTDAGLSNPLVFQVGTLPEFTAPVADAAAGAVGKGGRSSPPAAAPASNLQVTLPALVNGQILAGEVDRLHFEARSGQSLVVAANARSLVPYLADAVPGWFQAVLTLRDASGRELAYADDFQFRPDPVLHCIIPADGTYTVEIRDAIYRGREDFVYRLALGEIPFVQGTFPLGARQNESAQVSLSGWNLPATRLQLAPRADQPGLFSFAVQHNGTPSNRRRFALGTLPEIFENEPNDRPTAATISLPLTINGRIDQPDDRDVFVIEGRAGQEIMAEIFARRLDSPLDSHLTLIDPSGRIVAGNDDFDDKSEGLLTHQADSRLQVTLPHDGFFQLIVTDTQHRGGPDYAYRLTVRAPQPDFALRVTPSAVNLPVAASVPITVYAVRHDGFEGEIQLGLVGSPPGYRLSGGRIPAGQDAVTLTLTAPGQASGQIDPLRLAGTAQISGQAVTHPAAAADDTMQAFLYRHLVPARAWEAVITGRALPLRPLNPGPVLIKPGKSVTIRLATPGLARAIDDLKVELLQPIAGLVIASCEAREGEISFTVDCDPATGQPPPTGNLIATVSGRRPYQKTAAKAPTLLGTTPAIEFTIAP